MSRAEAAPGAMASLARAGQDLVRDRPTAHPDPWSSLQRAVAPGRRFRGAQKEHYPHAAPGDHGEPRRGVAGTDGHHPLARWLSYDGIDEQALVWSGQVQDPGPGH